MTAQWEIPSSPPMSKVKKAVIAGIVLVAIAGLVTAIILINTHSQSPMQRWQDCLQKSISDPNVTCGSGPSGL